MSYITKWAVILWQTTKNFAQSLPTIIGVILLLGLFKAFISQEQLAAVFTGNLWSDTILGALAGSIFAGQVLNSYIIGGELLDKGISLLAVTAFLLSWVTVGVAQIPAEMAFLGNKYAIFRNITSFILSILVAVAVVATMGVII